MGLEKGNIDLQPIEDSPIRLPIDHGIKYGIKYGIIVDRPDQAIFKVHLLQPLELDHASLADQALPMKETQIDCIPRCHVECS